MATSTRPYILGHPGGSLLNAGSWAASAAVAAAGRKGELATANVLDKFAAASGPTVIHDIQVPKIGSNANIDHILVSGKEVFVLDSKWWAPHLYWTARSRTRRGVRPFLSATGKPIADSQTLSVIRFALSAYLQHDARVHRPVVVVWPSSNRSVLSVRLYRPVGAIAITGRQLSAYGRLVFPRAPADQAIVDRLARLLR